MQLLKLNPTSSMTCTMHLACAGCAGSTATNKDLSTSLFHCHTKHARKGMLPQSMHAQKCFLAAPQSSVCLCGQLPPHKQHHCRHHAVNCPPGALYSAFVFTPKQHHELSRVFSAVIRANLHQQGSGFRSPCLAICTPHACKFLDHPHPCNCQIGAGSPQDCPHQPPQHKHTALQPVTPPPATEPPLPAPCLFIMLHRMVHQHHFQPGLQRAYTPLARVHICSNKSCMCLMRGP